jgi:alkylated DNA repair dioxygenase AlkB
MNIFHLLIKKALKTFSVVKNEQIDNNVYKVGENISWHINYIHCCV